jgi:hypothetical protein
MSPMLSVAMKSVQADTFHGLHPAPVAVFAGAIRRAWARISELGHGGRHSLEHAMSYSGGLESLLARNDIRRGKPHDGAGRVFRAPGLVFEHSIGLQPVRESRSSAVPIEGIPGAEHCSRLFKPFR